MATEVDKFLDLLADRGLLSDRMLAKLYRQIEDKRERGKGVPLDSLAKLLVDKGHLTQRQANSLINEVSQRGRSTEEEIGLAPIDEEPTPRDLDRSAASQEDGSLAETKVYEEELTEAELAALARPKTKKRNGWTSEPADKPAERPQKKAGDPLDELTAAVETPAGRAARPTRKGGARSEWESPLLLVGGGGLLLMLLIGVLVWYLLRTDTGDAQLRTAHEAYQDGAYSQAVEAYERFLASHSDHDAVSTARVRLGLARVLRALDSGASFEVVLEQIQGALNEIEREPAFPEAGRDLADILPRVAHGLADEASRAESPEAAAALSARTEEALALLTNTKYVPKSFRPVGAIEDVRRTLASVERRQKRQQGLSTALAAITTAREEQEFQEAYKIHSDLVMSYADVANLPEVRSAIAQIARAEATAIGLEDEIRPASTEDRDSSAVSSLLLTAATQAGPAQEGAAVAFVRIGGAVYGIDAATGEPIWRRFVGHAERLLPQPLDAGDVLIMDVEHGELLRLAGRTGELVWRQTIGGVNGQPVIYQGRVIVPSAESRLIVVDVETGETRGFVGFAQPLATSPTIDAESNRLAVVGERSIVYLLAADSLEGKDAVFVGHAAGSVTVPAALFSDTLCLSENFAANHSLLRVLTTTDDQGADNGDDAAGQPTVAWKPPIEPIRLKGRVTTPLAVRGRRLALATDLGEIRVFDVPVGPEGPPLSPVASREARDGESHERYLKLRESDLWLAGKRLMRLRILSTGGRLQSQDLPRTYNGDAFVHPLTVVGDELIHVRRPQGQVGHLVAATNLRSGEPLWEHELATPPSDLSALPDGSAVAVALANGRVYSVPDAWPSSLRNNPADGERRLTSEVVAPGGIAAMAWLRDRAVVQSLRDAEILRWVEFGPSGVTSGDLAVPGRVAAKPIPLGGRLVVPLDVGQVFLIDSTDGQPIAAPFQPAIRPSELPDWTTPTVVDPKGSFAIADRAKRVYLVELQGDPARLAAVAESSVVPRPLTGEICAVAAVIYAAAGNRLLTYSLPELAVGETIEFDRPIVWGPFRAGEAVLLATADERLHCLTGGRTIAEASLSAAAVGRPVATEDGSILMALEDGALMRVDPTNGRVAMQSTYGQPLAAGPVWVNGRAFAATPDGSLVSLSVEAPAALAAASISY